MKKKDAFVKNDICPNCGKHLDCATNIKDEKVRPAAFDVSICIQCGCFLIFDKELNLVKCSTDQFAKLDRENQILLRRVQGFILENKN